MRTWRMPWSRLTGCWAWMRPRAGMRCSGSWCWPGSSSHPASLTACGSWRRPGSADRRMRPSSAAFPPMRRRSGGGGCLRRAPRRPGSARPGWSFYDMSTLYFETDAGDGFREPGFSKERRLEPQITIGLLAGQDGFPLMVSAFEGNKAETKAMLPVIEAFMAAHQLPDITAVADAGMISEANQKDIEAAGLSFILGNPRRPLRRGRMARGAPRGGHPRRARLHPALARRAVLAEAGQGQLLQLQGRPGPPHPARHRRAGRQGSQGRRGPGPGQAEPVHRSRRRPRASTANWRRKPGAWPA